MEGEAVKESPVRNVILTASVVLAMGVCTISRGAPRQSGLAEVTGSRFNLPGEVRMARFQASDSSCYDYAVSELGRLLKRVNTSSFVSDKTVSDGLFALQIIPSERTSAPPLPPHDEVVWDGYALSVSEAGISIVAKEPKGVLNGVYDLAERLGYLFLYPGTDGEWPPQELEAGLSLPQQSLVVNPRFPFRGIFDGASGEEWSAFYAKMRFNALSQRLERRRADKLGFRLEHGGHQLDDLLPKEQFATDPTLFRLAQPEDFFGERVDDFNFCITNPAARKLIKENYRVEIRDLHQEGVYAWHTWHEDLPAGGWCLCPTCRSFSSSDLAMLAMSMLAEVVREENLPMRVPFLAYHDTLHPGLKIDPPNETFLLFAPRERCYAHALNDASCPRNRRCHRALREWMEEYEGISDAHTFEYYLDRVLFRGLYPFLPSVIIEDMRVYQEAGIESHMVLQVGTAFVPRLTMLNLPLFGHAHWDETLDEDTYVAWLAGKILPERPQPWQEYFTGRADIFSRVMRWEHEPDGWSDYRWIPETTSPYGEEMAKLYAEGAQSLGALAAALADAVSPDWPERVRVLAETEIARTQFEAAELQVMAHQQAAANHIGQYLNTWARDPLARGTQSLVDALSALDTARKRAEEAGIKDGDYYYMFNDWIKKEFTQKLSRWRAAETLGP
jgi:Domain of unknown function (DUF4838)